MAAVFDAPPPSSKPPPPPPLLLLLLLQLLLAAAAAAANSDSSSDRGGDRRRDTAGCSGGSQRGRGIGLRRDGRCESSLGVSPSGRDALPPWRRNQSTSS